MHQADALEIGNEQENLGLSFAASVFPRDGLRCGLDQLHYSLSLFGARFLFLSHRRWNIPQI